LSNEYHIIALWPGEAPGMPGEPPVETVVDRGEVPERLDRAVFGITRPRLAVCRPAEPSGAAVLIAPGGGFRRVVIDKEGFEIGHWLGAKGMTTFVLYYRLPGEGWADGPNVALADAQRAMRLIRHRADEFGVDPERVAAMGFSAGGHVCADLAVRFDQRVYAPVDDADELSARPALAALIYPVISMCAPTTHAPSRRLLIGEDASAEMERIHSPQRNVPEDAPPCFLVHAEDDKGVSVGNSLEFRDALMARGVPVETHIFARGGHGFGLRKPAGEPVAVWPELFIGWCRSNYRC
jgi:acetyl esterase/lipase